MSFAQFTIFGCGASQCSVCKQQLYMLTHFADVHLQELREGRKCA